MENLKERREASLHLRKAGKLLSRNGPIICLLFCCILLTPGLSLAVADEGIRADLPAGGELQISNWRGSVTVEVWDESYVSVRAVVEDKRRASRFSPIVIRRTERLLSIGVINEPVRSPARIDLVLHIPQRSRVKILTSDGEVRLAGLPVALSVQTVGGNINALLPELDGADVKAESGSGKVRSAFPSSNSSGPARASEHLFEAQAGNGSKIVRLHSERGDIILSPAEQSMSGTPTGPTQDYNTTVEASTTEARKPPTLTGGSSNSGGAGVPAPDSSGPEEVDEGDVVRVDTELVTLNMSVVDRGTNRGLTGLTQNDFRLYEDGVEQQIAHFESSSAPFNLVLLIDLSGSTRDVVKLIRASALRFINAARPSDRIGVITFAGSPAIVSPLTDDREALRERVNAMTTAQGDTKLYDALDFTIEQVAKETKDSRRTAIVLMSDGLDGTIPGVYGQQGSRTSYNEILSRIREFDGVLYDLWLNTEYQALSPQDTQPEAFDMGHDRMQEMADAGGGIFYEVESLSDLAGAYERVVADLGTVYSLSYRPTNKVRDGSWRAIRVMVARPNAVARGKRGYYAK